MSDETWAAIQLAVRILLALVFVGMGVNHFAPKAARVMAEMYRDYVAASATRDNSGRKIAGGA